MPQTASRERLPAPPDRRDLQRPGGSIRSRDYVALGSRVVAWPDILVRCARCWSSTPRPPPRRVRERDVLTRALGSDLKVDVIQTTHRGHAIELGAQAVEAALDLVVVLGGDGTDQRGRQRPARQPASGPDPHRTPPRWRSCRAAARTSSAARWASRATRSRRPASCSTRCEPGAPGGSASAGSTTAGSRSRPASASTPTRSAGSRRPGPRARPARRAATPAPPCAASSRWTGGIPPLTLERPGEEPVPGLFLGIVANTSPWTYFRDHPIVLTPDASFDAGLDLVGRAADATARGQLWRSSGMLSRGRDPRPAAPAPSTTCASSGWSPTRPTPPAGRRRLPR